MNWNHLLKGGAGIKMNNYMDTGTIAWAIQRSREAFPQPIPLKKQDYLKNLTNLINEWCKYQDDCMKSYCIKRFTEKYKEYCDTMPNGSAEIQATIDFMNFYRQEVEPLNQIKNIYVDESINMEK